MLALVAWVGHVLFSGCAQSDKIVPRVHIENTQLAGMAVAVAPAVNLSGSTALDTERFADAMASELSYTEGISVIPVSRVLAALGARGKHGVESPAHALALIDAVGADAILVFAVTEYDPYDPPSIGISAQLYGTWPWASRGEDAPPTSADPGSAGLPGATRSENRLLRQVQRVYHAAHDSTAAEIKDFAVRRDSAASPFGWRRYMVSQQDFIRFCCHATICALFNG